MIGIQTVCLLWGLGEAGDHGYVSAVFPQQGEIMLLLGYLGHILDFKVESPGGDAIVRGSLGQRDRVWQAPQGYQLIHGLPVALLIAAQGPGYYVGDVIAGRILERYAIGVEVAAHTGGRDVKRGDAAYLHDAYI
jgi:hypothetical protein